ncbi:MAG: hypothetical protein ICV87_14205 [Gemmatimonadetes bacterium]|nr:hypothetical protein [Gemmatimonadota bacterium]
MRETPSIPGASYSGTSKDWNVGASFATGVDLRVAGRVLLSPELRISGINSSVDNVGRLGSFRLGATVLMSD